tara:strand:- start:41 stop:340 length:300 start_codon:yes stop_codon:yes gene_type:complete
MKITLKSIETEEDKKRVGFFVSEYEDQEDKNTKLFAIDKLIDIVEGKTDEQYTQEAYNLAKNEINDWIDSLSNEEESQDQEVNELIGKEWDVDNNSFKE